MASVESQILVRIRALIEGLPQVKELSNTLKGLRGGTVGSGTASEISKIAVAAKVAQTALSPLIGIGNLISGVFRQVVRQVEFLAASFAIAVASSPALAFGLLVKEGIAFNSVMEQQRIGLAALIQSTNEIFRKDQPNKPLEGLEAYEAATRIAEASTNRLSIKLIPLRATLEDLLPIFNSIVTAGAAAGLTLEQTENVFTDLAAAAQVVNIPLDKLGTGIRLLLNGTARATTVLATALFGSAQAANEWVKEHKAIGDLADALHTKLEAFRLALITSETSFATLALNTKDVFQRLAGVATSGLFERLKAALVEILKSFYDLKSLALTDEFKGLLEFIRDDLEKIGDDLVRLTKETIDFLERASKYVTDNRAYIEQILNDLVDIAGTLGGIVIDVATIAGDADRARAQTASWHSILLLVRGIFAGIRDEINLIIGLLEYVAGGLASAILRAFDGVLAIFENIAGRIGFIASILRGMLREAIDGADSFAQSGGDRIRSGLENTRAEINRQENEAQEDKVFGSAPRRRFIPNRPKGKQNDFDTRLKNLGGTTTAGGGGGHRGGGSRADNKLADSLRELRDSLLDKALSALEARVKFVQFLMDQAQAVIDRQLANHLLSITQYYDKLLEIQQTAFDAQAVEEEAHFKRDAEASKSKIKALEDKADAAKNPKEREAFLNQILAERNKLAAKENEYSEKQAEIAGKRKAAEFQIADARDKALRTLEADTRETQAARLEEQGRPADAANLRIAGEFKDKLQEFLINFDNQLGPAVTSLISDIESLGGVSSEQFKRMAQEGGIAFESLSSETKALIEHMRHLEIAAKLAAVQAKFDRTTREQAIELNRVQEDFNRGKLTQIEYEKQINALNEANFHVLEDQLAQEFLLAQTEEDRLRIKEQLEQLKAAHKEINSLAQDINGDLRNGISDVFGALIKDPLHAADAIKKAALSMIQDMALVIVKALVLDRIFKALNILPGSTGGLGGVLSGLGGGGLHFAEGGVVSGPGTGTSDSIVARISNGEAVIPSRVVSLNRGLINSLISGNFAMGRMPRFATGYAPAAGGPSMLPPKVVVALDADTIANEMMSSAGERVFLHHFKKNRRGLGL